MSDIGHLVRHDQVVLDIDGGLHIAADNAGAGVDIQPPSSCFAKSIGHQHVLEPELRTNAGAGNFARHLLAKAAERLRCGDYYCRRLGLHVSWVGDLGGWWDETSFHATRDTGFLLARLDELWRRVPQTKPLSVGVVLLDLVPADRHQPDLSRPPANAARNCHR